MKKIFTFVMALAASFVGLQAAEETVWEGSEAISWNTDVAPGTQFETPEGTFTGLGKNDVIRFYTTTSYDDPQYVVTYKAGSGWDWTDLETTIAEGVISYTVESEQVAKEIAERGLVLRGQAWTLTKITIEKGRETITVTIGETGYATFSSNRHLDFAEAGITPYYASAVEVGSVTLTPIEDKTTWGWQGYILKGVAGTYDIPVIADSEGTYPNGNYLKATDEYDRDLEASTEGEYRYIFAQNGEDVGFYYLNTGYKLSARKAYLQTETDIRSTADAGVKAVFSDNPSTAIELTKVGNAAGDVYDLSGRKVSNLKKGVYIINGKKINIK